MLQSRFEPMFIADWERVLMIHFAVDAAALQRDVPFQLDLHDGQAFVTLVAFTMRGMRPVIGGRLTAWLFRPLSGHDFLNVRTYVRAGDEVGIHFLTEWVSNRLAVLLGPRTFRLPYRHGRMCEAGSLDAWLMERYSAFNSVRGRHRFFRVWHEPWLQCRARVKTTDVSLLRENWPWFRDAEPIGANYSPSACDVWLGRPRKVSRAD